MVLIVGGMAQGKQKFAGRLTGLPDGAFLDGASCTTAELEQAKAVRDFQLFIRRLVAEGEEPQGRVRLLIEKNPDLVIVSDEVGYGVVPIDRFEREYREQAGRCMELLAASAGQVYRVVCGIGMKLKG